MSVTKLNIEPREGLRINPSGGVIQRTGCNERFKPIVSLTQIGTSILSSDALDIKNIKLLNLAVTVVGYGTHDNVFLYLDFKDDVGSDWHSLDGGALAVGVVTLDTTGHILKFASAGIGTQPVVIPIMNPGASKMRIRYNGDGLGDGGSLTIKLLRSWGESQIIL